MLASSCSWQWELPESSGTRGPCAALTGGDNGMGTEAYVVATNHSHVYSSRPRRTLMLRLALCDGVITALVTDVDWSL